LGDDNQDSIARAMSVGIVDRLEAVEVEQQDRVYALRVRRRAYCCLQRVLELAAVRQTSQRIAVR
jgi:hypothetical protein